VVHRAWSSLRVISIWQCGQASWCHAEPRPGSGLSALQIGGHPCGSPMKIEMTCYSASGHIEFPAACHCTRMPARTAKWILLSRTPGAVNHLLLILIAVYGLWSMVYGLHHAHLSQDHRSLSRFSPIPAFAVSDNLWLNRSIALNGCERVHNPLFRNPATRDYFSARRQSRPSQHPRATNMAFYS